MRNAKPQPESNLIQRYPSIPYVAPFAAFIFFLSLSGHWPFEARWEYPARVIAVGVVILLLAPKFQQPSQPAFSIILGIAVFALWVGPDVLFPAYRSHWLFQNRWLGTAKSSMDASLHADYLFLIFRIFGTAIIVPIVEELFWRGWLMRTIIDSNFRKVSLGTYGVVAFWLTAILFASEHGPFWDVGLLTGVIYNVWMIRTRNLGDCILMHGVTNACLAFYVVGWQQWQYWL